MKNPLNKLSKINKLSLVLMSLLILDSLFTSGLLLTGSSFLIWFVSSFGFGSIIVIGVRFVTVGGVEVFGMLLGVVFGKSDGVTFGNGSLWFGSSGSGKSSGLIGLGFLLVQLHVMNGSSVFAYIVGGHWLSHNTSTSGDVNKTL